jgi:hypothetical protein
MEEQGKKEEQEKTTEEQTLETEEQQPQGDQVEKLKETTEKIWGSTRHAWSTATFKASQYKKLVQKKIDISALHKKISLAHADLGKLIDDLREAGRKNIMNLSEVREILTRLDDLKAEAASLEEEAEQIRTEEAPQDEEQVDEKTEE